MVADQGTRAGAPRWEKALTVLVLFALTKPFYKQEGGTFGIVEHELAGNLFLGTLYTLTLVLLIRNRREVGRLAFGDPWLAGLVALAILSAQWSLEPYITLRAGFLLVGTTSIGLYLAARYTRREQVEMVAVALTLGAGLSLLSAVLAPSIGVSAGDWRGIYPHKNNLGRFMTLGAITCALAATQKGPWRKWAVGGAALSMAVLIMSGSSTAVVVIAAAAILTPIYVLLGAQLHLAIAVLSATVLLASGAAVLLLAYPDEILALLGRNATLTGRTALWTVVVLFIAQRPWLGYGYQAFWFGQEDTGDVVDLAGWTAGTAHNGFLDLAMNLGLVGLALFLVGFVVAAWKGRKELRRVQGLEGYWPLLYLAYFFLYNLTETSVLIPTDILWATYVGTCFSVAASARQRTRSPARETGRRRRYFRDPEPEAGLPAMPQGGPRGRARAWRPGR